ncbi:MAG: YbhB/YbcL family Raf kinase inhibitor-like protein [Acidobacteria bacterium]|nr:YbhB/YbcL family Raf kinase inhibitor-like protein [Acidobacteriota bacterium]
MPSSPCGTAISALLCRRWPMSTLELSSLAFQEGGSIPREYTCDGKDISPPLAWDGIPDLAVTLSLICDDPDAPRGTWVHWVLFNLPATVTSLPAGVPGTPQVNGGGQQGINDFRKSGYGGPCPPSGTHRYYFRLYALDVELNLGSSTSRSQLSKAMEGHVLAEAQLMGRYAR